MSVTTAATSVAAFAEGTVATAFVAPDRDGGDISHGVRGGGHAVAAVTPSRRSRRSRRRT